MKLCDKCYLTGDIRKAVDTVVIVSTDETFDLCESCIENVRDYLNNGDTRLSKITRKT